jgi:hypothetical protein
MGACMPTPQLETVQAVLRANNRDLKLRTAILRAWEDVQGKYPDRAWWRRKTTLRSVMWEHCVDRVMEVVNGDSGLVAVQHYDTASFIADDSVLFRLKKANAGLFSSNYPTPLAQMFHRHDSGDLFGHHGHQRVEIVHTFNRFQTAVDWVGVVAREGKKVIWDFELRGGEAGEVIPFPVQPTQPAGKSVIKPIVPDAGEESEASE